MNLVRVRQQRRTTGIPKPMVCELVHAWVPTTVLPGFCAGQYREDLAVPAPGGRPIPKHVNRITDRVKPGFTPVADLNTVKAGAGFTGPSDRVQEGRRSWPFAIADKYHIGLFPLFVLEAVDHPLEYTRLIVAPAETEGEECQ